MLRERTLCKVDTGKPYQQVLGLVLIRGVKGGPDIRGHRRTHGHLRHILPGILLQMELAALLGNAREDGFSGRLETLMGVTYDQFETVQTPIFQLGQERPPVDFGFRERHRAAQYIAVALGINATGDQHRRIQYLAPWRIFSYCASNTT